MWYHNNVGGGRCPIVDTFWQTETGGHMITPMPGATPLVPGRARCPFPGIQAAIVDETGHDVPNGQGGILVVKKALALDDSHHLGRPRSLQEELLPRRTRWASCIWRAMAPFATKTPATSPSWAVSTMCSTSRATAWAPWRSNRHWSPTALVAEAAVVGRPDDTTGEAIVAFVVLKAGASLGR
jgi:acetyl-CoA synthetase